MSQVPDRTRGLVTVRDRFLCVRCALKGTDLHHRRSRSVSDGHTHCSCNLVLLCPDCHRWAHTNPFLARGAGLIVSKYVSDPFTKALETTTGEMKLDCEAGFTWVVRPWQSKPKFRSSPPPPLPPF